MNPNFSDGLSGMLRFSLIGTSGFLLASNNVKFDLSYTTLDYS
jgi:hypothetical protein